MDFKTKKKFDKWISIIKECETSGLRIYDWCKKNNISTSTFYFWKKKIEMILNNERLYSQQENNSQNVIATIKTKFADITIYSGIDNELLQKILNLVT